MARSNPKKPSAVDQIHLGLLDLIQRSALTPGDKLPSEDQLTQRFDCSRPTLREALKILEQDGIIETQHGRGRFLTAAASLMVERPITCFESVSTMMRGLGYKPTSSLISVLATPAGAMVANALQCSPSTTVARVERLRFHERKALVYSLNYLRIDDLPIGGLETIDWTGSVVELLRGRGKEPVMSTAAVSAVTLPRDVSQDHHLADFGAALLITETCFTNRGEAVLFAQDYHRGDAFSFSFARR